ncbi:SusC/RagA family TonB-linked outer membrane protein [Balneolaceae bacterium YR4-1]|uniref:SusC/RagA family TonB-linked outer membrane protein n=1 Tax=Halalkalibaculum roseum TaxID=2709311 RepID=A0A6M1T9V4_9BACT|nr:SusC/RagA family TonB-linked outer membrane protein [Halalkalibaculum roseum]NGP77013.1 SusC/RagA family TonB-linked outer membrane protein [Halalkalibaculum roseum]
MLRKILSTAFVALFMTTLAYAQSGSITGVITDQTSGEAMPGVTVQLVELNRGAATNIDGVYAITNVPAGTYTLRASFVGFKARSVQVTIGSGETTRDLQLQQDILGLEEVVVTGVGTGTETTKLGFSVAKVGEQELTTVPAADVGSAIQAKVPGVTIVKASGDPSRAATIRLRGSTSLSDDQEPLIIVDGIITDGSLADINMQDVESIEIVKGAAAASLYGSLAGNGVIQIITKRGSKSIDKPQLTFRSEYGFSTLGNEYPVAKTHPWVEDYTLTSDGAAVASWPGFNTYDADRVWDNEFPVYNDNLDAVFEGQPYNSNFINVANSSETFNYYASYENLSQEGVIKNLPNYNRNSVRLNADYTYDNRFRIGFSGSYVNVEYPDITEQGQGSNFFYSVLTAPPIINFNERNPNGTFSNSPQGYDIVGSNFQNPLYVAEQFQDNFTRDRYIMGFTVNYEINDNFTIDGRQSFDKRFTLQETFAPVGYQTPTPSTALNNGFEGRETFENSTSITELWATGRFQVEDLGIRVIAKYLYEDREFENYDFSGFNYSVSGIRNFGAVDSDTYSIGSEFITERAENIILDSEFDYQDKLILGGMVRRDGSSSFGEDERYSIYYRGSLAYRVTEDIDINNVQELKLRVSYGTSGLRPPFEAQYETYSAGATVLLPNVLGNTEIKPSVVAETEFGVDVAFLDKFNASLNYSWTNTTNDYLLAPLGGDNPFSAQWQNVGEIENRTFEASLQGNLVQQRDLQAGFNLSFSKTLQKVTDLGGVPAFTRAAGAAINLFRFEEGVSYGAMYGNKLIGSVNELTLDENGFVLNAGGGTLTPDDFSVNSLGHVVITADAGTQAERPMYLVDETGTPDIVQIGDTQPDFQVGLSGNFNWKNLGLFMVWDWSQGGEVYNYSKQLLYFNFMHADLEDFTRAGFDPDYALASDGLYNASNALSHFVEDASYLKLREVSLSYTLTNSNLGKIGNYLRDVQFSVVGRNLLTFTDYTGYDPEVALRTNSTNFRIDEYSYPNFRTFSGSVRVRF